jgi:FtsP/CotA-like multicopper oxidase with cupredoxin domain
LNIGIGQRYDVVIDMDQEVDSYFLRAVTQTQCPSTCNNTGLAQANGIIAYEGVQELPYLLPTSTTTKTIADFNICDDEPLASLVPALPKPAGSSDAFTASASTLPAGGVNVVASADDGFVFRWFINSGFIDMDYTEPTLKVLADKANSSLISNSITLPDGNVWVYFVIQNQFFASHPMHLHGHDFSLLGQGPGVFNESMVNTLNFVNPMRRDTAMLKGALNPAVGVPGYTVIGFETDNPGAWLMHCHIIWHVDGGLSLQWLERPDDIKTNDYVSSEFLDNCAAYDTYESSSPNHVKLSWESGLKKRSTFFDEQVAKLNMGQFDSVVRRSDSSEKRYLDNHALKRGIGHSRHFRK